MPDVLPDWKTMDPAERLTTVSALAAEGLSAGGIAARFANATRMSVISLCHRRKVQLKGKSFMPAQPRPPRMPKPAKAIPRPRIAAPHFDVSPLPEEELGNDVTHLLGIMDLKAHHCRYIHGDPLNVHGYCGKTTKANSSWCEEHHAVVFPGGRS